MMTTNWTDKQLEKMQQEQVWIQQARAGDKRAFAAIVAAYQAPVYNLAYRMLGNPTEAEDAAQEVFLRAYTRLNTYDAGRKFSSWILSVASHYCIDLLRRRRHHAVSLEDESPYEQIPDFGPRPEQVTLQHEQSEQIQRLLESLPADYRLAITLRYWHNLSYTEMAETLHTTESAVKSRLHRAREAMAEKVRQEQALAAPKDGERRPYLRPATSAAAHISAIPIM